MFPSSLAGLYHASLILLHQGSTQDSGAVRLSTETSEFRYFITPQVATKCRTLWWEILWDPWGVNRRRDQPNHGAWLACSPPPQFDSSQGCIRRNFSRSLALSVCVFCLALRVVPDVLIPEFHGWPCCSTNILLPLPMRALNPNQYRPNQMLDPKPETPHPLALQRYLTHKKPPPPLGA